MSELAKLDFLADYEFSVRGERAAHVEIVDWMEQKRAARGICQTWLMTTSGTR